KIKVALSPALSTTKSRLRSLPLSNAHCYGRGRCVARATHFSRTAASGEPEPRRLSRRPAATLGLQLGPRRFASRHLQLRGSVAVCAQPTVWRQFWQAIGSMGTGSASLPRPLLRRLRGRAHLAGCFQGGPAGLTALHLLAERAIASSAKAMGVRELLAAAHA